ncbi:MAG: GNAT family protein [Pseudomonadota bacterium]
MSEFDYREIKLSGRYVFLRPPRRGDFKAWSALRIADRHHVEPWEPAWPEFANSRRDWRGRYHSWRSSWQRGTGATFFVFENTSSSFAGSAGLTGIKGGAANSAMLGYWLGKSYVGKGFMTEAVNLVADWAFSSLGLSRIEAGTLPENEKSQRVLERCHFQREGVAREYLEIAGKRRDHVLYAKLASDPAGDSKPE